MDPVTATTISKERFRCGIEGCSKSYNRQWKLERHLCTHTNERPFKCAHIGCNKSYMCKQHLQRHNATAHAKERTFIPCAYVGCSKLFSSLQSLKKHCKTHLALMPYECTLCHIGFKDQNKYVDHVTIHTGLLPYSCESCGNEFSSRSLLSRHERRHKTSACDIDGCAKVFSSHNALREHMKIEHATNYVCSTCSKEFINKALMRDHVLSHLPQQVRDVFACPYSECGRSYYQKRNLSQHIAASHTGVRYPCDEANCDKTFAFKASLLQHKIRHKNPQFGRKTQKATRKPRKDKGKPKSSIVSSLLGIQLPFAIGKVIATGTSTERTQVINDILYKQDSPTSV